MNRYAVIDLGTNTFHLLIAQKAETGAIEEIYRERRFVKLAEEGIALIGADAFARGLQALRQFRDKLEVYCVPISQARVFGTAALRTAKNGPDFIEQAAAESGIQIQLISGEREAALIHKGVILAVPPPQERMLIMDIGGGSVEFIISNEERVLWSQSFPIGVAVLYLQFHRHEPILPEEQEQLQAFLKSHLLPLQEALRKFPAPVLVGASGTFDVLAEFLSNGGNGLLHSQIEAPLFAPLFSRLLLLKREERHQLEGIPPERADMIIVALILIDLVMEMASTHLIITSAYAMKEGMLFEMMQQD